MKSPFVLAVIAVSVGLFTVGVMVGMRPVASRNGHLQVVGRATDITTDIATVPVDARDIVKGDGEVAAAVPLSAGILAEWDRTLTFFEFTRRLDAGLAAMRPGQIASLMHDCHVAAWKCAGDSGAPFYPVDYWFAEHYPDEAFAALMADASFERGMLGDNDSDLDLEEVAGRALGNLARRDPQRALELLLTPEEPISYRYLLRSIPSEWPTEHTFALARFAVERIDDPMNSELLFFGAFEEAVAVDFAGCERFFDGIDPEDGKIRFAALRGLLNHFSKDAPETGVRWLLARPELAALDVEISSDLFASMLLEVSRKRPVESEVNEAIAKGLITSSVGNLRRFPGVFLEQVASIEDEPTRMREVEQFGMMLSGRGGLSAVDALRVLEAMNLAQKEGSAQALAAQLCEFDSRTQAAALDSLNAMAFSYVRNGPSSLAPEALGAAIANLPKTPRFAEQAGQFLNSWKQINPDAAIMWLSSLDPGPLRDAVAAMAEMEMPK